MTVVSVGAGPPVSGSAVGSGTTLDVANGGVVVGTTVDLDGSVVVMSGGIASATTIVSGGVQFVSAGIAFGTTIDPLGHEGVFAGGTVSGATIASGGVQYLSGGTAYGTSVGNFGYQEVFAGGVATGATVDSGGAQYVSAGLIVGATIDGGGVQAISSGGSAVGTTLQSGAVQYVNGGIASATTVESGAVEIVSSGSAVATIVLSGGSIDLPNLMFSSAASATPDPTTGVLTVVQGGSASQITLAGSYGGETFVVSADSGSGTLAVLATACFRAGTRILTERGDVPVQSLRVGDRLVRARGGWAPVQWLGRRTVDCRRHPRPSDVWPIRVAAGAFAAGQPHRDLWLSPDHAVFVNGVLIPIRYLADGIGIVPEPTETVEYWHVELPLHDVLLAEGLPAESYLDTGNRGAFADQAIQHLHPDFGRGVWEGESCAPLAVAGPALDAARRMLSRRAQTPAARPNAAEGRQPADILFVRRH